MRNLIQKSVNFVLFKNSFMCMCVGMLVKQPEFPICIYWGVAVQRKDIQYTRLSNLFLIHKYCIDAYLNLA